MKYVVVLADGMADEKIDALDGKTPLEYASTPHIDAIAPYSEIGLVSTIPEGCAKGSDTANLSVLGYDPEKYAFGRSPLEALSMGVVLEDLDVTFRANVITLSETEARYEDRMILDHSSDEISTEEARELILAVKEALGNEEKVFYPGISYRHLLVWKEGSRGVKLTPPHDILGKRIEDYKPVGDHSHEIWEMMKRSYEILKDHPINKARKMRGLKPANSIWIWGEGVKPQLPSFGEKYGVKGAVISAVDLIKGIGIGAGMTSINVEGATGNLHTNYKGKTAAALKFLLEDDGDFVYIHLEGPDECGHRNEMMNKILSIEYIDSKVIGPVRQALEEAGEDYRLLVLPDHPTPLRLRTHTDDPVPYMLYDTAREGSFNKEHRYNETYAKSSEKHIKDGYELIGYFLSPAKS